MHSVDRSYVDTPEMLKNSFSRTNSNTKSKPRPPPSNSSLSQAAYSIPASSKDEFQILVFGYKEGEKNQILQKLEKFGMIDEAKDVSKFVMGVKFKDPKVAAQASSLNGQVVLENTMIGVNLINKVQNTSGSNGKYLTNEDSFSYVQKKKTKKKLGLLQKFKYYFLNLDPEESFCGVCRKGFVVVSVPKRVCRFCGKSVCKKCSAGKFLQNSEKRRICDKCLQGKIQETVWSSTKGDIRRLIFEKQDKTNEKLKLEAEIECLEKKLLTLNEQVYDFQDLKNKEMSVLSEKKKKLEDSLHILDESLRNISMSEAMIREKVEEKSVEIEKYNRILIEMNQHSSELDDRIFQTKEFLQQTMNENDRLHQVVNEELTEFVIKGKRLNEKIMKGHRMTMGKIESMNYDSAFLSVQVKELEKVVNEKKLELALKKDMYANSYLYLSANME